MNIISILHILGCDANDIVASSRTMTMDHDGVLCGARYVGLTIAAFGHVAMEVIQDNTDPLHALCHDSVAVLRGNKPKMRLELIQISST